MAGRRKREWPTWVQRALQGVPHWIAHRRCLFRGYALSEGALVAEICNLVQANLPNDYLLRCEVPFAEFLPNAGRIADRAARSSILTQKARADLVIFERKNRIPRYVIEVKRASASKQQIDRDLERLSEVKRKVDVQAFMFLISEANRPDRFVNSKGASRTIRRKLPGGGRYRVLRSYKALHSRSNVNNAQYGCLVEVE